MQRMGLALVGCAFVAIVGHAAAQRPAPEGPGMVPGARAVEDFVPVTDAMLRDPDPADWLMYNRTYDAQRFSPLDQITRENVGRLQRVWQTAMPDGVIEIIPIVYRGVMYLSTPGGRGQSSAVWAVDATTGERIWAYQPDGNLSSRIKAIAIYDDLVFYTAPAGRNEASRVVALDARTGEVRWETPVTVETHTAGAIVVDGLVISGRTCNTVRDNCYIAAHDATTGEEAWRFYPTAGEDDPGNDTWGGAPESGRRASTWGLPGGYDPERRLLFWGISNPMPNTRADRHGGDHDAVPRVAPSELYSNSTVALRPDTGELVWYYQHLPGDDWDMDINHEKTLIRTVIDPDPAHVKWINPDIPRGVARDVVVTVGEGGGLWVNDRDTGQFIWATPFPFDTEHFILSDIDVRTGRAYINWDLVLKEPGARSTICYWNTRSYWPTAYHPGTNSLYVPYVDHCLDMTRAVPGESGERRTGTLRPGGDQATFAGFARIDMTTGEMHRFYEGRAATNGAVLATAGGLVFWGDLTQVLRAYDARTGEVLWESEPLGATVQTSTITYAVDGRQYIAVIAGENMFGPRGLATAGGMRPPAYGGTSINVFALP
jgi:alcohol dehydrogenase (cytochrome c)